MNRLGLCEEEKRMTRGVHRAITIRPCRFVGLSTLLALALFGAACGGDDPEARPPIEEGRGEVIQVPGGSFLRVDSDEFERLAAQSDAYVLNVHVPYEGEIEGTNGFVPYNEIKESIGELPEDREVVLLVYCQSGRMSTEAAGTLISLGFSNVVELKGGMIAWQQSGRGLEQHR